MLEMKKPFCPAAKLLLTLLDTPQQQVQKEALTGALEFVLTQLNDIPTGGRAVWTANLGHG